MNTIGISLPAETLEEVCCPLCGNTAARHVATEVLPLTECAECRLVYVNPRIREPEKNYWFAEQPVLEKYENVLSGQERHVRYRNYREHMRVLSRLKPSGKLLDVGTHCGWFMDVLRDGPWEIQGIEPSPTAAKIARERFGLNVVNGYLREDTFPPESFDVVTLLDVIEHVTHPVDLLSNVHRVLRPGGIVFIKTPNLQWNLLKHLVLSRMLRSQSFDIFDSREHVVQYTQTSLTRMLEFTGFSVVQFRVPRPVHTKPQPGRWWRVPARESAYWVTRGVKGVTGKMNVAPDLAVIARK